MTLNRPICAGLAISKGMPYEKALEAVTINPARVMGVEARVGSLAPGKDADLVIWKDRPFVVIQDPVAVFIKGERIKKTKRGACASRFWALVLIVTSTFCRFLSCPVIYPISIL